MAKNEFLKIRVTDIDWDTEENGEEDDFSLPKEIFIDDHFKMDDYIDEETKEIDTDQLLDDVSDYISDLYGFCHGGFHAKIYKGNIPVDFAAVKNVSMENM